MQTLILFIIFGFLILCQCSSDTGTNNKKDKIEYSFFVAGHTYGKPGVDNIGFHPPFREKLDFIKQYPTLQFGVLTGDIVWTSTEQNWDEIDDDIVINNEFPNDHLLKKVIDALSDEEILIKLRRLLGPGNLDAGEVCPEFGDCSDDCEILGIDDCPTDNTGCSTLA